MNLPKLRVPMGQDTQKRGGSLALFPKRNLGYSLPHTPRYQTKPILKVSKVIKSRDRCLSFWS